MPSLNELSLGGEARGGGGEGRGGAGALIEKRTPLGSILKACAFIKFFFPRVNFSLSLIRGFFFGVFFARYRRA